MFKLFRMQKNFSKSVFVFSALVFLSLLALNIGNSEFYKGTPGSIIYHYGVPAVLAGAAFYALRLSVPASMSVALCLVSVVIGLYAAELYLSFEKDGRKSRTAATGGLSFDGRTKIEVIKEFRQGGDDAYPVMPEPLSFLDEYHCPGSLL